MTFASINRTLISLARAAACVSAGLTLSGCGGSGASIDSARSSKYSQFEQCSVDDVKAWVGFNMDDYYLFYDELPRVDASDYESAEAYIRALRVAPYDRYSYVTEEADYVQFFEEGKRFGFGMRLERNAEERWFFSLVEPQSPLGGTNVQRGDELLAINGVATADFTPEFISTAFGAGDEVVDLQLSVRSPSDSEPQIVTITKATYSIQTVLDADVLRHGNHRVGYLNFLSFLATSEAELNKAFSDFDQQSVDELVLDLRFNGGGRISIAEQMGSLIAGSSVNGTPFTHFRHNDKYARQDTSFDFLQRSRALNLDRLYVLTSADTCSASEMVINSLRPFIDVVTIGDTTCGKPYGTGSETYCGKSMNALEVEFQNAAGVGGYFDGIAADCPIDENLAQPLGQHGENLLQAALYHLDTGQCATPFNAQNSAQNSAHVSARAATANTGLSERAYDYGNSGNSGKNLEPIVPVPDRSSPERLDHRFDETRPLLGK